MIVPIADFMKKKNESYYWQNPRVCASCVFCHPVNDPFKCCPDNAAFCDCPTEYGGDGLVHNTYSDMPACPRYRATLTDRYPD